MAKGVQEEVYQGVSRGVQVEVYEESGLFHATSQKPQAFYGQPIKVSSRLTSPDRIDYSSIRLLPARHDTWERKYPSSNKLELTKDSSFFS